jgi:hypothetical protein
MQKRSIAGRCAANRECGARFSDHLAAFPRNGSTAAKTSSVLMKQSE